MTSNLISSLQTYFGFSSFRPGQGESIQNLLDNQHTFVLILEADDKSQIDQFMQPFSMAGPVEVYPASECETVVERAGC